MLDRNGHLGHLNYRVCSPGTERVDILSIKRPTRQLILVQCSACKRDKAAAAGMRSPVYVCRYSRIWDCVVLLTSYSVTVPYDSLTRPVDIPRPRLNRLFLHQQRGQAARTTFARLPGLLNKHFLPRKSTLLHQKCYNGW